MSARPPRMDKLLASETASALREAYGERALHACLTELIEASKRTWRSGGPLPNEKSLMERAEEKLRQSFRPPLRRVINATGVVLHTNLGRAPLPEKALRSAAKLLSGYVDLELDLQARGRGHRDARLEAMFRDLFGTDRCLVVVNNNAAATLLMLNTLSAGKETVVSRGELVEIGGGFRMPEVMAASGALLKEVGTTNRTRLSDYQKAVGQGTGLLLKVHTSNYRIRGFTEDVSLEELVALGREVKKPVGFDLGSGLALAPSSVGLTDEPTIAAALAAGPDALCFSADKLFGACQAGLLLVAPKLADRFRKNPVLRAMRADKMAYATLGVVLDLYRRGRWQKIPALALLGTPTPFLLSRARRLKHLIEAAAPGRFVMQVLRAEGRVGGGCAPLESLPSPAVAVAPAAGNSRELEEYLRAGGEPPVLAQLVGDRVMLHLRTLLSNDLRDLVARFKEYAKEEST
jgi:L-seryl-tRNA(Ser) seleniumtransferase